MSEARLCFSPGDVLLRVCEWLSAEQGFYNLCLLNTVSVLWVSFAFGVWSAWSWKERCFVSGDEG